MSWLERFYLFAANKQDVAAELLTQLERGGPLFHDGRARILAASRPLFQDAQRARVVRSDITIEQVLDMVVAIATIRGSEAYRATILRTALAGLRPERTAPGHRARATST